MRRDWEQTKHDFSKKAGAELNQDVGDTLKQMAGKEPVGDWNSVEPAMRFGYGAGHNYKDDAEFNAREKDLERDWNDMSRHARGPNPATTSVAAGSGRAAKTSQKRSTGRSMRSKRKTKTVSAP